MARFKFYFDDVEVQEPFEWANLVTSIKLDRTVNGIFVTQDATLTFWGDAHDYLKNVFDTQSFCEVVSVRIVASEDEGNTYQSYFYGKIFICDVEFDALKKYAKTKIQDNSYDSLINNNKSTQGKLQAGRSKNDESITVCPYYNVELFDFATGTYQAVTGGTGNDAQGRCYRMYDILQYLVAFMTDDALDFDSTVFAQGGDYEGIVVTSGYMLKGYVAGTTPEATFNETWPLISWDAVISNLKRLHCSIFIEYPISSRPKVRIEKASYLTESTDVTAWFNVDDYKISTAKDRLFSTVKFGSGNLLPDATAYQFNDKITFIGFAEETFNVLGQCNIDSTLDLSTSWAVSHNAIAEALDAAALSDMADDDLVMIACDTIETSGFITSFKAKQSNWITNTATPQYYNEFLNNNNISLRYNSAIPNSIANFLSASSNAFMASLSADSVLIPTSGLFDIEADDDVSDINHDDSGLYDATTFLYSVPASSVYTFFVNADVTIYPALGASQTGGYTITNKLYIYDSGGTFLRMETVSSVTGNYSGVLPTICSGVKTIVLNSGEKVGAKTLLTTTGAVQWQIKKDPNHVGNFGAWQSNTGGGIYQTYDPNDYSIIRYEFKAPCTATQFASILANLRGLIEISVSNVEGLDTRIHGRIESFKMNQKGQADVILYASKRLNQ